MATTKFTATYEAPNENIVPFAKYYGYVGDDLDEAIEHLDGVISKLLAGFIKAPQDKVIMKQYDDQLIATNNAALEQIASAITIEIKTT